MKHFVKIALSLTLAVLFAVSAFAGASGRVTYEGDSRKFIFAPGSEYSPSDLFPEFKNVMPGDVLTQRITVDNDMSEQVKIKVYLRSTGAEEGSEEFLSRLKLRVTQDGTSKLFLAPADESADLTDWTYLGLVYSGGKIDLDLVLEVPAELGDEFQYATGILDWQFKVEEFPIEKDDPVPETGDFGTDGILWFGLMAVAVLGAGAVLVVFLAKRKKKEEDQ